jgi:hypothetical protein
MAATKKRKWREDTFIISEENCTSEQVTQFNFYRTAAAL